MTALDSGGPRSPPGPHSLTPRLIPPPQRIILYPLHFDHACLTEPILTLAAIGMCGAVAQEVLKLAAHVAALDTLASVIVPW